MARKIMTITAIAVLFCVLSACGTTTGKEPTGNLASGAANKDDVITNESDVVSHESEVQENAADEDCFSGYVEDGAFVITKCTSEQETIVVPDTIDGAPVEKIGVSAFFESPCKHIVLPDTVTFISKEAFLYCHSLQSIEFGNNLQYVGLLAFSGCNSLRSVSFPDSLKHIELVFFMCDNLKEVYVPPMATEVDGIADAGSCPNIVIITGAGSLVESTAIDMGLKTRVING